MFEIGVDPAPDSGHAQPRTTSPGTLQLLYVGRFLQWKGMGLGLSALARLRERGIDARLTMIGNGPDQARWQSLCRRLGIADSVSWIAWMKQDDLLQVYRTFDALLFPSLHDSSGNVVLESLACGLPVVCLALGGPAQLVDDSCGRVVPVAGRNEHQVIDELAGTLERMAGDPALLASLREGALARARRCTWQQVVSRVWGPDGCGYRLVAGGAPLRQPPGLQLGGRR
jgi:glycosyltransferase involved in cell wall biosynthesis